MNTKLHLVGVLVTAGLVIGGCRSSAGTIAATPEPPTPPQTQSVTPSEPTPAQQREPGGTLLYTVNAEPLGLDPLTSYSVGDVSVMAQVYDPLVFVDGDRKIHAGLATSWEQSSDAKMFTFELRQGVTFHDGTPFNAEAVKFNFDRLGDPTLNTGQTSVYFGQYLSTEVLDPYTVRVSFSAPHPNFIMSLGTLTAGIASPTAVAKEGADYGKHPVGTGPFMFSEWLPGTKIVLVRNPDYDWAPDMMDHQGPAYLESVVFQVVGEEATRVAMLQTGESSVSDLFEGQDTVWLKTDPEYYLTIGTALGLPTVMFLNVTRFPTDELAVRQALVYAVDQETLVQMAFSGNQPAAHGVLAPGTLDYDQASAEIYHYDPAKAKEILDQAGWVDNGSGVRMKNGKTLEIYYPAYSAWEGAFCEILQNMWSEVGFSVKLEELDDAAAWAKATEGDFNVTNMGSVAFDASVLWQVFDSSQIASGLAFTHFEDKQLDDLLEQAAVNPDATARAAQYAQAQALIMNNALLVPIYLFARTLAVRSEFQGVVLDWQGWYPYFYDVYVNQ
jgi:peptide/nickel transport system substrate-binding protein